MSDVAAVLPPPDASSELDALARENLRRRLDYAKELQAGLRTRAGRIKDAKFKAAVLALRWEEFSPKETADILGTTIGEVKAALRKMREAAELDDHIKTIDHEILPIAIDNLAQAVLKGDVGISERLARGRGVLRTYKQVESSITKRTMKLTIDVKMSGADGAALVQKVRDGSIVGQRATGGDQFLLEEPKR